MSEPGERSSPRHSRRSEISRFSSSTCFSPTPPPISPSALPTSRAAPRAVAGNHRRQRGVSAAVNLIDRLSVFAALMLEVDVDVGWSVPLLRHEAIEQQLVFDRVDRAYTEHGKRHRSWRMSRGPDKGASADAPRARSRRQSGNSAHSRARRSAASYAQSGWHIRLLPLVAAMA